MGVQPADAGVVEAATASVTGTRGLSVGRDDPLSGVVRSNYGYDNFVSCAQEWLGGHLNIEIVWQDEY